MHLVNSTETSLVKLPRPVRHPRWKCGLFLVLLSVYQNPERRSAFDDMLRSAYENLHHCPRVVGKESRQSRGLGLDKTKKRKYLVSGVRCRAMTKRLDKIEQLDLLLFLPPLPED